MDIAVDPIDGTRPLALGLPNSISTVAMAPRGCMFNPGPIVYMKKIAVGPEAKDAIDITLPTAENLRRIARAKGKDLNDLTAVILDRERHRELIGEVRSTGARILLIPDGDVAGALMTAWQESNVDVLLGVGGTPEGVIAACALRAMGGNIQGILHARSEEEARLGREAGFDMDKVLMMDDLVASDDVFFAATGLTDGHFLRGVKYVAEGAETDSLVVRGLTGTVRHIVATHRLTKLGQLSGFDY